MPVRKLKPIEERDPYAALVLDAFDEISHSFDDNGVCKICCFDSVEWLYGREGNFEVKFPICKH